MKKLLTTAAILAITATSAMANMHGNMNMDKKAQMKAEKYFTEMDMDSDGKVTMDESRKFGDNMFNEVDTDNNNYLTKSELVEHKKMEMKKWHDMKADSIETETNTTTTNTKKTSY